MLWHIAIDTHKPTDATSGYCVFVNSDTQAGALEIAKSRLRATETIGAVGPAETFPFNSLSLR